ncbi:SusD/RagB family nutrient-binding outer membrane lipoprotein [Chitinophaga sp. Cy-1792]|uniref:SusD/RagB family nutrient-binding outer membrane lipoprotein n=1 Tax=Chitinophaga sp. Cy-1792 TaxID=2608339 RepID=UPI00141F1EBD|nr:SusD/RagB family nutrient-binding outer membrane lipoprotein [Chitinophaga sp. Cy-1792]NIG56837.1 SusD/RagB family nutrient-binding outer membrane lipoprotein [Chitinophaga sp. Cy-1792]
MKQLLYIAGCIALVVSTMLSSCTKGFDKLNTDPNSTANALPQQLLAPALVNSLSANLSRNRSFNNELMQVTVNMSDAEGQVFRYDYRASWSDYLYTSWYNAITDFKALYSTSTDSLTRNTSYQGISMICQSWLFSMLTDTYGDMPYFKAGLAKDSGIMHPPFDAQKDIYLDIFKQLDSANTLLSKNAGIVAGSDPVYNGDVTKWRKFGNSLYLRLLLRVSGKSDVADQCIAKIKDILEVSTSKYPIMTTVDESAILRWTGQGPYTSPLLNVREQDFRSPAICSFFIDNLAKWNDPRIDIPTYGSGGYNRWAIVPYSGMYAGVPSGYSPGDNYPKKCYFNSYVSTSTAPSLMSDAQTGIIMNYAELCFIKAEAALKGWIKATPGAFYNSGAQASIQQWLPNYKAPIDSFLAAADIQWLDSETTDEKMEKIHVQKYYALFMTDLEQWFEYRRTGHPVLPKGHGLMNGGVMPARMTYPVFTQSTNPDNYKKVVASQGPDVISTQVWWQRP